MRLEKSFLQIFDQFDSVEMKIFFVFFYSEAIENLSDEERFQFYDKISFLRVTDRTEKLQSGILDIDRPAPLVALLFRHTTARLLGNRLSYRCSYVAKPYK